MQYLISFLTPVFFMVPVVFSSTEEVELYNLFKNFTPSYERIKDYSSRFVKEELRDEKWEKEVIDFRFKKPFKVKMKWLSGFHKNRQVVFVEGANQNKVLVKVGGLFGVIVPKLSLDPNGQMARDENGHTIREAGLGYMMEEIWKITEQAYRKKELRLKFLEKKSPILAIERTVPRNKGYPTPKLVVYVDETLGIPVGVERYDESGKLLGKYYYADLKINQGLGDEEFKL